MINRRHLRIKVMQALYAARISHMDTIDEGLLLLRDNIDKMHELYLVHMGLLVALRRKAEEIYKKSEQLYFKNRLKNITSPNVQNNRILHNFEFSLKDNSKINKFWEEHNEMLERIWNDLTKKHLYKKYIALEQPTFSDDKQFVIDMFRDYIAPSDILYDFYTGYALGWADDYPSVNTRILQHIKSMNPNVSFEPDVLFKFPADLDFAMLLLKKAYVLYEELERIIDEYTPNWDRERIMPVDRTLLVLALTEFLEFPSIPTRVTINEYIEISKDYASDKSAFFINGVLDKLLRVFTEENKIVKNGKGLK
jgi:N utilization substance protein B